MHPLLSRVATFPTLIRTWSMKSVQYARAHKIIATILLVAIAGGVYLSYSAWVTAHAAAEYTLARATTDTIQENVTGSGQIASSHTLTLSPKAAGTVMAVRVAPGQNVTAGTIIATIDATDAQKNVRDAKLSLDSARLSYEKQQTSVDAGTAAFNTAATALADMQEALDGMDDILHGQDFQSYKLRDNVVVFGTVGKNPTTETMVREYVAAQASYDTARALYDATPRTASVAEISTLLDTMKSAAQALSQANKDILAGARATDKVLIAEGTEPSVLPTYITSLTTYGRTLNTTATDLASAKTDLSGSVIDTTSDRITLTKAENTYQDALDTLEDYIVRAPFAGTIATVDVQKYDEAGSATKVATLITNTSYAELSLSETDAAKVAAGQKAELTFDAVEDLTVSGSVIQIDPVGTVASGVVSYTAKIGLDSNDPRIKPGMTVNATIITAEKTNTIVVPSAAVKTQNGKSYIEVASGAELPAGMASSTRRGINAAATSTGARMATRTLTVSADKVAIERVFVEVGLTSDTMTEIVSGIAAGDHVVTQTTNANGKAVTKTGSIFSMFGGTRSTTQNARSGTSAAGSAQTAGGAGAVRAGSAGGPPNF